MYERAFKLEIITPNKVVFRDEASSVTVPGVQGSFQVLYNHAPLLSSLEIGELRVKAGDGKDFRYATSGGFLEVKDNLVTIIVETVEAASAIDVERAKASQERASKRLHSKAQEVDMERARASLLRAVNRIRVAEKS
jgi:F-type H+-transporting ATPase subunit epsilon